MQNQILQGDYTFLGGSFQLCLPLNFEFQIPKDDPIRLCVRHGETIKMHHLKKLRRRLAQYKKEQGVVFVHGIGRCKTPLQRLTETLDEYIRRMKDYHWKLHTCGRRNSFAKTDTDATFMRMKEDAMKNGAVRLKMLS